MPDVKVCLWNIQNYGQNSQKYNGGGLTDGKNSLRNEFVARFVKAHEIDVLLIQEVTSQPRAALEDLRSRLNAISADKTDWCYSWCGSAMARSDVDKPAKPTDLAFRTGARTEGYAVLWRDQQVDRFTMMDGLYPIGSGTAGRADTPLNISLLGRPTGNIPGGPRLGDFGATGSCPYLGHYPFEPNPDGPGSIALKAWPRLNYPPTSKMDRRGVQWSKSRRPAYIVLKLNDTEKLLCPVSAYHAPSNQGMASWGAYVAGLSRELYAVNAAEGDGTKLDPDILVPVRKGLFGGDFNLSVNRGNWPGDYGYFVAPYSRAYDGGASRRTAPSPDADDPERRTTVQLLKQDHKTPITTGDTDDYLKWKIDLAFFTAATKVSATRVDLLKELISDGAQTYKTPLERTRNYLDYAEVHIADDAGNRRLNDNTGPQRKVTKKRKKKTVEVWIPTISGAWGGTFVDWNKTKTQFGNGKITDARRAAEYIHIFVSDHLPLIATIPV